MKRLIIDTEPGVDDAHAILLAVAVEPDIVTRSEKSYMSIELHGSHTRGQTVVDWYGLTHRRPNTEIILELDQNCFVQFMGNGLP